MTGLARAGAGLTAVAACLLGLAAPGASGQAAAATPESKKERRQTPVGVSVEALSPSAPGPESTIKLSGRVVNETRSAISNLSVRLRYSPTPFRSRSQIRQFTEGGGIEPPSIAVSVPLERGLPAGKSAEWRLSVKASALGLAQQGAVSVHPLEVEAVTAAGVTAGQTRTYLPYATTSKPPARTNIAWVWPIVDRPHRADDSTFMEDDLAESVAADGRLNGLVEAAAAHSPNGNGRTASGDTSGKVPLTWAIDPALLNDAEAMSKRHRILDEPKSSLGEGGPLKTRAAPASADAKKWLDSLRGTVGKDPVLALPYADTDVVALIRRGLEEDVKFAVGEGRRNATRILGRSVDTGLAWTPDGMLIPDAAEILAGLGARSFIVSDRNLPVAQTTTYTPDAAAKLPTVGGDVNALIADSTLRNSLQAADTDTAAGRFQARQRFLAETAMITAERPYESRSVVVAPPRRWNPGAELADALLGDTASVPWLKPVRLADVKPSGSSVPRGSLNYPERAEREELGPAYLKKVGSVRSAAARFTSVLINQHPYHPAVLRMESSAWRHDGVRARRLREAVSDSVTSATGKINILSRDAVTLAGESGTVPITVGNELPDQTVRVRLRIRSGNAERLSVGSYKKDLEIGPGRRETVKVPLSAKANGLGAIKMRLDTPDGEKLSDEVVMPVSATALGSIGVWIAGAGGLVFIMLIVLRVLRRRATLEEGPEADEGGPFAVPDAPDDADQTGRTADGSGDGSSAGSADGEVQAVVPVPAPHMTQRTPEDDKEPPRGHPDGGT